MFNKIKAFLSRLWLSIGEIAGRGGKGPLGEGENRITILTNIIGVVGPLVLLTIYSNLRSLGFEGDYLLSYFVIAAIAPLAILFNKMHYYKSARVTMVVFLNLTAWNAAIFYGKSFNGHYLFFIAIVYSILAFPRTHWHLTFVGVSLSFIGLPFVDWLSHSKVLPITGLSSFEFSPAVLYFDSLVISICLALVIYVEKRLADRHEDELVDLNRHLEDRVTERTKEVVRAKEEAIQANLVKSQFVANTSHELRTPLGAVIGFLDLIQDGDASEEQKSQYIQIAKRNAKHLAQIIDEILDLSRIEAQKLAVENQPVDLDTLLDEVAAATSFKAQEKGLKYLIIKTEGLPSSSMTDSLRLKQILVNLVGNAVKFTYQGFVHLHVSLQSSQGLQYLQFDVSDSGPGIAPNHRSHLFEPFWQADSSSARKFGGTGLGLSLSRHLARLLNGSLELLAQGPEGGGSTFRLRIPYNPCHEVKRRRSHSSQLAATGKLSGVKILLVDDSPDNQTLVSQILMMAGASVEVADNGADALEKIDQAPEAYSIVLMDLQMPVLNGYQATEILRRERHYNRPIVALTAHAMKEERDRAEHLGFNRYLTKPVNRQELLDTVAEMTFNGH